MISLLYIHFDITSTPQDHNKKVLFSNLLQFLQRNRVIDTVCVCLVFISSLSV